MANAVACNKYNPEEYGAQCSRCYLYKRRQGGPVPAEINLGANLTIAAEAPGGDEVEHGRPLIGPSGQEIMRALAQQGVMRQHVTWSNAFLCRPPGNDLDRLLLQMKRENKERVSQGLMPWLSPIEACRPRFLSELRIFNDGAVSGTKDVLTLGKISLSAITGHSRGIMDIRGAPIEGVLDGVGRFRPSPYTPGFGELATPIRVVPTIHPAFVLRAKRWRRVFHVDVSRAVRWFRGALRWQQPQAYYNPDPDTLEYFLLRHRAPFYASDVETEPTDPMTPLLQRLRCVGFGTTEVGMVVGLLSRDGVTRIYPADQEELVREIIARFYEDPSIPKVGHNFGYFDRISIKRNLGCDINNLIDTILLHRGVWSELPHNLGFVGSTETDMMEAWKADHVATEARTDQELWEYNLKDCVVNARILPPLLMGVQARGLTGVIDIHHKIQELCVGLHENGMYVDQEARRAHDTRLRQSGARWRGLMREILGDSAFNPNSRDQVADVLFNRWGLTPDIIYSNGDGAGKKLRKAYTASGAASTGDDHLRAMLLHLGKGEATKKQRDFIQALRFFRRDAKVLGTNIRPLRAVDEPAYADQDDFAVNIDTEEGRAAIDEDDDASPVATAFDGKRVGQKYLAKKLKEMAPGLTLLDGRVHPHYNAHATTTQRLSSSNPNGQNWTRSIRDMICAMIASGARMQCIESGVPGVGPQWMPDKFIRALVYADMDQLELRFAAALARAARYLEVFHNNGDPHDVTCEMLFGAKYKHASGADKEKMRGFGKRFSYAVLYKATVETVHETIASAENDAGELVFPDITLKETRVLYDRWLKQNPEFITWWERDLNEYRTQRYLVEPIFGWRRDFLDGEDSTTDDEGQVVNEVANFKCQSGGSAVVHLATMRFVKEVPFGRWGPGTGLIQQGHDALMGEVPAVHAPHECRYDKSKKKWVLNWCPPKCKCVTRDVAHFLQECMTVDGSPYGLPVKFTAKAKIAFRWSQF